MKLTLTACATVVAVVTSTQMAIAHHSFTAEFDADKPIRLTGTVTRLEWTNPHTWFYIDVTGDAGTVANWAMEMGSPNSLMRAGWTRSAMKSGDLVTVEGFLARDKPNVGNARVVTLASTGQRLFAASSQGR
jgi:hypothetical protein